jgi:hypothetical protein
MTVIDGSQHGYLGVRCYDSATHAVEIASNYDPAIVPVGTIDPYRADTVPVFGYTFFLNTSTQRDTISATLLHEDRFAIDSIGTTTPASHQQTYIKLKYTAGASDVQDTLVVRDPCMETRVALFGQGFSTSDISETVATNAGFSVEGRVLQLIADGPVQIELFDLLGRPVLTSSERTTPLHSLAAGVYFYRLNSFSAVRTGKIVLP